MNQIKQYKQKNGSYVIDILIVFSLAGMMSFRLFPGMNNLYKLTVFLTILLIFYNFFLNRKKKIILNSQYLFYIYLFFMNILISYTYAIDKKMLLQSFGTLFQFFLLSSLVTIYMINNNKVYSLPYYLTSSGLISLLFIYLISDNIIANKVGGDIVGTNGLSYTLLFSLISAFYIAKNKKSLLYYAISLFFLINIVLTGSRQVIITLIILVLVSFFYKILSTKSLKFQIMPIIKKILVILLLLRVIFLFQHFIPPRIIEIFTKTDINYTNRNYLLSFGYDGFLNKPIIGHGFMNYSRYVDILHGVSVGYSHNNYIQLLFDLGLVGLIIYYLPYIYIIKKYFKRIFNNNVNSWTNYIFICVLALLIEDVFTLGLKFGLQYLIVGIGIHTIKNKESGLKR